MKICVIGLGYVGLPLALAFSEKNTVIGYDISSKKIQLLKSGTNYLEEDPHIQTLLSKHLNSSFFPTSDEREISDCNAYIIAVPTPVDENKQPILKPIQSAAQTIAKYLKHDDLVVLESTTYPGTTDEFLVPILENESNLQAGNDFYVAFSPERINPGSKWKIQDIPKLVGGINSTSTQKAVSLYKTAINTVIPVSSAKVAEAAKILENSFRAVNIAFVNEFAKYCQKEGIDFLDVVGAAKTKPYGFMPFYASLGVGGHCIPVDPHYLIQRGSKIGFNFELLPLSMQINNEMPYYVFTMLKNLLHAHNINLSESVVTILGVTYKKDVPDVRESPAIELYNLLKKHVKKVKIHDPVYNSSNDDFYNDPYDALDKSHILVFATNHTAYDSLDWDKIKNIMETPIILDGKNALNKNKLKELGFIYKGIGR